MIDVTRTARQVGMGNGTVSMTRRLWKRYVTRQPGRADGVWRAQRCVTGIEVHRRVTDILRRMVCERKGARGTEVLFGVALVTGPRKRECVAMVAVYRDRDVVVDIVDEHCSRAVAHGAAAARGMKVAGFHPAMYLS